MKMDQGVLTGLIMDIFLGLMAVAAIVSIAYLLH